MKRSLEDYHRSIGRELGSLKDRVRNLIGGSHWPSDGGFKEAVFRNALRQYISESTRVGHGFVCYPPGTDEDDGWRENLDDDSEQEDHRDYGMTVPGDGDLPDSTERVNSKQLDVLVTDSHCPTLFKDGEMVLVTPDAVVSIIEVKTRAGRREIEEGIRLLADESERIATANTAALEESEDNEEIVYEDTGGRAEGQSPLTGLFVYEDRSQREHSSGLCDEEILTLLSSAAQGKESRAVDLIAVGSNRFFRFWENACKDVGGIIDGPAWHSYLIPELAPAYFIHNIVARTGQGMPGAMQILWFPLKHGKEDCRQWYVGLEEEACSVERFRRR